jgi:diguanylate cyclase (GGDEF)-like protein
VTDTLTGLANRRALDAVVDYEWTRALRTERPLSLLLIDVDQFKLFNDRYGHLAGDECLQRLGKLIDGTVRKNFDLAARFGGEEFSLLLAECEPAAAVMAAERLRRAVEMEKQPHRDSKHGIVTVSVGVASTVPSEGKTAKDLFAKADDALNDAKRNGRNCVRGEEMHLLDGAVPLVA